MSKLLLSLCLTLACALDAVAQVRQCALEAPIPSDAVVFAAGGLGKVLPFQIDQSGHEARQVDVVVNVAKPVVLILGTYEPTIWNIQWAAGGRIVAVFATGYHRQAVAGVPKKIPVLISTYDNRGPCGYASYDRGAITGVNPLSRRLFGRPADMFYPTTRGGIVHMGEPLTRTSRLETDKDNSPESYWDKNAPFAGPAGLEDAVRKGLLRKATPADSAAWALAAKAANPNPDVPPVAGEQPKPMGLPILNTFVVLKEFTYPAGLYGGLSANFIIPKGVPKPRGDRGHSTVYDFDAFKCTGIGCR